MHKTLIAALLATGALGVQASAQSPWMNFTNVSGSKLISQIGQPGLLTVGALGSADEREFDMTTGDFNGDGWLDLVIVCKEPFYGLGARRHILLMNNGSGSLADATASQAPEFISSPSIARDVQVGDMDGDFDLDIVIGTTGAADPELYINDGFVGGVWQGFTKRALWFATEQGNTSFTQDTVAIGTPGLNTCAISLGDTDNDGDLDILIGNYASTTGQNDDRFLENLGPGLFREKTSIILTSGVGNPITTGVDLVDINNDGWLDYALTSAVSGGFSAVYNNGAGKFTTFTGIPGSTGHYMHAMSDHDGDGFVDGYAVGDQQDATTYNLGNGGGSGPVSWSPRANVIDPSPPLGTDGLGGNAKAYDFDGNGKLDIGLCDMDTISSSASSCNDGHPFLLLRNRVTNTSNPAVFDPYTPSSYQPWNVDGTWDFEAGDFDNDGDLDLVFATCNGLKYFHQL